MCVAHLPPSIGLIIPASPDGRDLAPLLAARLGRPLLAGAINVRTDRVTLTRAAGRVGEEFGLSAPFVATLVPGVRGTQASSDRPDVRLVSAVAPSLPAGRIGETEVVTVLGVLPADPATIGLAEATRIVAGGNGLGSQAGFDALSRVGAAIGASLGGTRVASDAGWIGFDRQIGTTGVAVSPRVYVAFGIAGATQHTAGLGSVGHVISVNTDASCPMMAMADLAIVSDAAAVVAALERRLVGGAGPTATDQR